MQTTDPVKIGVMGFGTVGTGVIRFLLDREKSVGDVQLSSVAVADPSKPRDLEVPRLIGDPEELAGDPEIDLIVELMGGELPAVSLIMDGLSQGKAVVTANKVVVSRHMDSLFALARDRMVDFAFEAAVAGSIPIIQVLRGLSGQRIQRVTGILNGTSNYILSRMEEGMGFEEALNLAQEKGYAEAAHELDTGGFDARDKLAILASLASGTVVDPEEIHCEGIVGITSVDLDFAGKHGVEEDGPGFAVKSLASAHVGDGGALELHVYPALIPRDHPLAAVRDEMNAIYLESELAGPQLYLGRGAGREATASAVVADILRVSRNLRQGVVDPLPELSRDARITPIDEVGRRGYIRMNLRHLPGSIAEAARLMGQFGFNIEDSIQRRRFRTELDGVTYIPDIVTVETLPFGVVQEALEALQASDRIQGHPFYLRFED